MDRPLFSLYAWSKSVHAIPSTICAALHHGTQDNF
jgi:hypothetical protein